MIILQDEFKTAIIPMGPGACLYVLGRAWSKNWKVLTSLPPIFIWLDIQQKSE